MRTFSLLIGIVIGVICGSAIFLSGANVVIQGLQSELATLVMLVIAVGVGGTFAFLLMRYFLYQKLEVQEKSLPDITEKLFDLVVLERYKDRQSWVADARTQLKAVSAWYVSVTSYYFLLRYFLALTAILAGMAASLLIFRQNELIEGQSKFIQSQTETDLLQSLLAEAARRSASQETLLHNLLELINSSEAIRTDGDIVGRTHAGEQLFRYMSPVLYHELRQSLPTFTPYVVTDFDISKIDLSAGVDGNINLRRVSPEKGRILQALVANSIEFPDADHDEVDLLDFSYADLRDVSLIAQTQGEEHGWGIGEDCENGSAGGILNISANFSHADLSRANLEQVSLSIGDNIRLNGMSATRSVLFLGELPEGNVADLSLQDSHVVVGRFKYVSSLPIIPASCLEFEALTNLSNVEEDVLNSMVDDIASRLVAVKLRLVAPWGKTEDEVDWMRHLVNILTNENWPAERLDLLAQRLGAVLELRRIEADDEEIDSRKSLAFDFVRK